MVAVVAGDGLEHGLEGEAAALGMAGWPGEIFRLDGGEEAYVPGAESFVGGLGGGEVAGGVTVAPAILVEGLKHWIVGGEGLTQAPAPDDLAVGEVGHEFAEAPLVLAGRAVDLVESVGGEELAEVRGGGADDVDGLVAFKVMRVGIFFHGDDGSTQLRGNAARC